MKNVKNIFLLLLVTCFTIQLSAQKSVEQVLRKYKNNDGVLAMNLTGDFLDLMEGSDLDLDSEVNAVDLLIFNDDTNVSDGDWDKVEQAMKNENYELLINMRDGGKNAKVYTVENGEYINKLFAHVKAEGKNIYFIVTGKIKYDDLNKLSMDFEGGDIFKALDSSDFKKEKKMKKEH